MEAATNIESKNKELIKFDTYLRHTALKYLEISVITHSTNELEGVGEFNTDEAFLDVYNEVQASMREMTAQNVDTDLVILRARAFNSLLLKQIDSIAYALPKLKDKQSLLKCLAAVRSIYNAIPRIDRHSTDHIWGGEMLTQSHDKLNKLSQLIISKIQPQDLQRIPSQGPEIIEDFSAEMINIQYSELKSAMIEQLSKYLTTTTKSNQLNAIGQYSNDLSSYTQRPAYDNLREYLEESKNQPNIPVESKEIINGIINNTHQLETYSNKLTQEEINSKITKFSNTLRSKKTQDGESTYVHDYDQFEEYLSWLEANQEADQFKEQISASRQLIDSVHQQLYKTPYIYSRKNAKGEYDTDVEVKNSEQLLFNQISNQVYNEIIEYANNFLSEFDEGRINLEEAVGVPDFNTVFGTIGNYLADPIYSKTFKTDLVELREELSASRGLFVDQINILIQEELYDLFNTLIDSAESDNPDEISSINTRVKNLEVMIEALEQFSIDSQSIKVIFDTKLYLNQFKLKFNNFKAADKETYSVPLAPEPVIDPQPSQKPKKVIPYTPQTTIVPKKKIIPNPTPSQGLKPPILKTKLEVKIPQSDPQDLLNTYNNKFNIVIPPKGVNGMTEEQIQSNIARILGAKGSSADKISFLKQLKTKGYYNIDTLDMVQYDEVISFGLLKTAYSEGLLTIDELTIKLKTLMFNNRYLHDFTYTSFIEPVLPMINVMFQELVALAQKKGESLDLYSIFAGVELVNGPMKRQLLAIIDNPNTSEAWTSDKLPSNAEIFRREINAKTSINQYFVENSNFESIPNMVDELYSSLDGKDVNLRSIRIDKLVKHLKSKFKEIPTNPNHSFPIASTEFAIYISNLLKSSLAFGITPSELIDLETKATTTTEIKSDVNFDYMTYLRDQSSPKSLDKLRSIVTGHGWDKHKDQFKLLGINSSLELYQAVLATVYSKNADQRQKTVDRFVETDMDHIFTAYVNTKIVKQRQDDPREFALLICIDGVNSDNGSVYIAPLDYINKTYPKISV
jgi:hypothetical protein